VGVVAALLDALAGRELGQDAGQQASRVEQLEGLPGTFADEHLAELVGDPLDGDDRRPEPAGQRTHGGRQRLVELETQLGGEAHRAEHPERVVAEGRDRVERRPQEARLEVGQPGSESVLHPAAEIHQQRVDGEVAAAEVLVDAGRLHIGLARVVAVALRPRRGELDRTVAPHHLGSAEALEDDRRRAPGEPAEVGGQLRSTAVLDDDVDLPVLAAEEPVAHVAAHGPGANAQLSGRLGEERKGWI